MPSPLRPTIIKAWLAVGAGALLAATVAIAQVPPGGSTPAPPVQRSPRVEPAARHDLSPPLRLIKPARRQGGYRRIPILPLPRPATAPGMTGAIAGAPPLAPGPLIAATNNNFEGIGQGFVGPSGAFTIGVAPPDTDGDVGPSHYVQIVNTDFAVFSKSGTPLFGPVPVNTLWSGFLGGCQTNNDGDVGVLYDPIADRWIISQHSDQTTPFLECVAVSQTGDPTGAYYRYAFQYTTLPDYPKMGVWPDAYYETFNMFDSTGTKFQGGVVCAYDRAAMLRGAAATQQCFNVGTTYGGLLPADLDGGRPPPAGSPNYVLSIGAFTNQLAFWKFHVDWTAPANSTLTGPTAITVPAFVEACGGGTCIPQSGTTQQLDSVGDRLMFRLAYRNFGNRESLVANQSVTSGASVGVRWYELRLSASHNASLFQQGTYAPDSNYRWMGSIAQDQTGNIALGFSVSGVALNPQIHYTGRLVSDAAGTMSQGEGTIINGGGSQLTALSRWGDYSAMTVDPIDDCTFYYTNEYLAASGTFNWHSRVGSFKLPNCPQVSVSATTLTITAGQTATLIATPTGTGPFTYQWYQGLTGNTVVPVAGATGASFTTPASLSTTTRYWVQVTSAAGIQNSATITITVNSAAGADSSDAPLPPWALGVLCAGLVAIASRRLKKAA